MYRKDQKQVHLVVTIKKAMSYNSAVLLYKGGSLLGSGTNISLEKYFFINDKRSLLFNSTSLNSKRIIFLEHSLFFLIALVF